VCDNQVPYNVTHAVVSQQMLNSELTRLPAEIVKNARVRKK